MITRQCLQSFHPLLQYEESAQVCYHQMLKIALLNLYTSDGCKLLSLDQYFSFLCDTHLIILY
jgi:hypothetical protein